MKNAFKSGISLIAVLLFMLAATTASIIVFRWISQENFSSGARLKASEAYQASQAGLEAVQGWLTNKGADAGALLKVFDEQTTKQPVRLFSNGKNLLGDMKGNKGQSFDVYLTEANTDKTTYKLKFLSVGTARDGSKHIQVGIFNVEGLYKTTVFKPGDINVPNIPAFFGGIQSNTQGRFSSAIINGDLNVNGLSTQGNLIVTGNMSVMDNGEKYIGCRSSTDFTRVGDMYVLGNVDIRGFTICGDAYIGGLLTTTSDPQFLKGLYADGGIKSNGLCVYGNTTLGGDLISDNGSRVTFDGDLVMDPPAGSTAQITIVDGSLINAGGNIWSMSDLFKTKEYNANNRDKYGNLKLGGFGKRLLSPPSTASTCTADPNPTGFASKHLYIPIQPSGKAKSCATHGTAYGCGSDPNKWFQQTFDNPGIQCPEPDPEVETEPCTNVQQRADTAHFSTLALHESPNIGNKPAGALLLTSMAEQIEDCTKPDGTTYKCVPDPLEVPLDTRTIWLAKGKKLATLVSQGDTTGIPEACRRLVKAPQDAHGNFDSHWGFGDDLGLVSNPSKFVYPSMGDNTGGVCNGNNQYNFLKAANDCYRGLRNNNNLKDILYQNGDMGKKFLPLVVKNPQEKSPCGHFEGHFIFAYEDDMASTMKLPPTTDTSNVFLYFKEGATANMPLEETCSDLPTPCKRNYFIFSEKDIAGSTGSATINGAIFLANGSKVTGSLPDAMIEFNPNLYKELTNAGIIRAKDESWQIGQTEGDNIIDDKYYIPSTSHLRVKLESQYASEEKVDISTQSNTDAKPAILVMPRAIYLTQEKAEGININSQDFKNYYSVLYLNGATKPATEALHNCQPSNGGIIECILNSASTTCGNSTLCSNHPFFVIVTKDENDTDEGDGEVTPGETDGSTSALSCTAIGSTSVKQGQVPALASIYNATCSNGGAISEVNIIGPDMSNSGTYYNITVSAKCNAEQKTAACPPLTITPSQVLKCNAISNPRLKVGSNISDANIVLSCSDEDDPSNTGALGTPGYPTFNTPSSLAAGSYSNFTVQANCSGTYQSAICAGPLTVVGLECTNNTPFVKAGYNITTAYMPTLTCTDNSTLGSTITWTRSWGNSWTLPSSASAETVYSVGVSAASCGNSGSMITDLSANCGTVTVAGINCNPASLYVGPGGSVPAPALKCTHNNANATGVRYTSTPSSFPFTASTTVGTAYSIAGTAHCGTSSEPYLRTIAFTCPTITVADLPPCDFQQSWCPEIDWETGIKWGEYHPEHDANKNGKCYFWDGQYTGCNGGVVTPGDGGYYVYFNNSNNSNSCWNFSGAKAMPTTCKGPVYTCPAVLTCGDQTIANGGTPSTSYLHCSCGLTPSDISSSWNSGGFDKDVAGEYYVTKTARCVSGGTNLSTTCKVTVAAAIPPNTPACNSTVNHPYGTWDDGNLPSNPKSQCYKRNGQCYICNQGHPADYNCTEQFFWRGDDWPKDQWIGDGFLLNVPCPAGGGNTLDLNTFNSYDSNRPDIPAGEYQVTVPNYINKCHVKCVNGPCNFSGAINRQCSDNCNWDYMADNPVSSGTLTVTGTMNIIYCGNW